MSKRITSYDCSSRPNQMEGIDKKLLKYHIRLCAFLLLIHLYCHIRDMSGAPPITN
jgi:hypothetical protein